MQRSGILSGPGLIVVACHGLLAALYVVLVECGLAPRALALLCGGVAPAAGPTRCGVCAKPNSRAARRVCCACFALPGAVLAALAAAWALLQQGTPEGVWGGASWVAAPEQRVAYPSAGGAADLCFAMTNYTVKPVDTSYMCRAFAFPPGAALHATDFIPIVDRADLVHHMILYATTQDFTARGDARGVFNCASMPKVSGPVFVWAVGAPDFALPALVGAPVGANIGAVAGVPYGVLQVHYSNLARVAGASDSSGIMIRTTSSRRPVDAGIVQLGTTTGSISIPPNRAAYGIQGTCGAAQTGSLPPAASINPLTPNYVVVASAAHAHTLGRRIWTEQWRRGGRVRAADGRDPLGSEPFYSFANQRFAPAPGGGAPLAPGDELITRCVYENTRAAGAAGDNAVAAAGGTVLGCESTTCEMCLSFLWMYPRAPGVTALACSPAAVPFCEDRGADGGGPATSMQSCGAFT